MDHRVPPGRHQGGRVQRGANWGTTAVDQTLAFERPAVARQRCDTDERGNLFAIEGAEFRKVANQRATDHWPARSGGGSL